VLAAMEGYHSSVFVYGQTGTGKTYTMQVGGRRPSAQHVALHVVGSWTVSLASGRDSADAEMLWIPAAGHAVGPGRDPAGGPGHVRPC
jgi:hypothetical protein